MSLLNWFIRRPTPLRPEPDTPYNPEPKVERMDPEVQLELARKSRDTNKAVQSPVNAAIERMNDPDYLLREISNLLAEPTEDHQAELRKYSFMIKNVRQLETVLKARMDQVYKKNQLKEVE